VTLSGRRSRLRVLEARVKGAKPIEVGGGRRIVLTPAERYETLIDALAGEDTPAIQAIRSGRGKPDRDQYADLIQALDPVNRKPPSGDPESPWVDAEDPADDLIDDLIAPEELFPGGTPGGTPEE
jgi:hypothetical protein